MANVTGNQKVDKYLTWTGRALFAGWIGVLLWGVISGRFQPPKTEPHKCDKIEASASPITTVFRAVPGTSEQDFLECARRHDSLLRKIRKLSSEHERDLGKPISDTELTRLSKMTQDQRDEESCQRDLNSEYLNWNQILNGVQNADKFTDQRTVKFYRETYAFCKKFR
jgi:hypothetical protein